MMILDLVMPTPAPIDPTRCPLCNAPNQCGMAAGRGTCWCFEQTIPREVLARVPEEAKDRVCVCARCAAGERGRDDGLRTPPRR